MRALSRSEPGKIGLIDLEKGRLAAFAEELRQSGVSCTAAVDSNQRKRVQVQFVKSLAS